MIFKTSARKKTFLTFLLLFILTLPSVRDLFRNGSFTSHDLGHHIPRLIHVDNILREGQIPPRWTGDLNKGYGYPLLLFNYPLPYYLGELFHLSGFDFIWSIKMVLALSLIGSIFTSYIFFRELFGRIAGIVGGVFYLYAPIRFINVYVSATVGNALAFLFVPLPFYAIARLKRGYSSNAVVIGAIGMSGLILSHNIIAFMFVPILVTYFLYCLLETPKKFFFLSTMFSLMLGLGIAAYFWLPALVEKQYIRYAELLPGFYNSHFPTFRNLLYMPWGYGFAWPGDNPTVNPGRMSFQIGLAHLLVIALNSFLLLYTVLKRRQVDTAQAFFLFWFYLSIFFMLKISGKIWDAISVMQYLQMPWRILAASIFTTSVLAAYIAHKVKFRYLTSVIMILLVIYANRNHWHINQVLDVTDDFYRRIDGTTTMAGEHLPPWGKQMTERIPSKMEIVEGSGTIQYEFVHSDMISAVAHFEKASIIRLNQFYFPGWKILVDGEETPFSYFRINSPNHGLPHFYVTEGRHSVVARFTRTPIRILADTVSIIAICLFGIFCLTSLFKIRIIRIYKDQ